MWLNPRLTSLQPYPFERLRALLRLAPPALAPIRLSIGEPQHATPQLSARRSSVISTGCRAIRRRPGSTRCAKAMAAWFGRRYALPGSTRRHRCCRSTALARRCSRLRRRSSTARARRRSSSVRTRSTRSTRARRCSPAPSRRSSTRRPTTASTWTSTRCPTSEWRRTQLDVRLLAGQPDRAGARPGRLARAFRARRSLWLRHRVRRVLLGDLSRRSGAAARRARGRAPAGPRRLPQPGRVHQPVEAIERAGPALGRRRRRRRAARAVPALSHVSWKRDEPAVQHASIAAWSDEAHVRDNRARYREKFAAVVPMLAPVLDAPAARRGLLLWAARARVATTRRSRGSCSPRRT